MSFRRWNRFATAAVAVGAIATGEAALGAVYLESAQFGSRPSSTRDSAEGSDPEITVEVGLPIFPELNGHAVINHADQI